MKVLMLGWEFPPFIAGGLGTACYGLTRALNALGTDVLFVLPRPVVAHAPTPTLNPPTNGHAHSTENPPPPPSPNPIAMVNAHYNFPHAQQAGTPTVTPPPTNSPNPNTLLHSPFTNAAGETQLSYLDYNRSEFQHVTFRTLDALLSPYLTPEEYRRQNKSWHARPDHGSEITPPNPTPVSQATPVPNHNPNLNPNPITIPPTPSNIKSIQTPPITNLPPTPHHPNPNHNPNLNRAPNYPLPDLPASMLIPPKSAYATDLLTETNRYASLVAGIAHDETFDIIHAHDWMTFRAGMAAQKASGMPLILHVHSTEFDRNPHAPNPDIIDIETQGLLAADRIIAVSHMTRRLLVTRYAIPEEKISVVHNAIDGDQLLTNTPNPFPIRKDEKVVLFLGRITAQKGPEYFLAAARKVLDVYEPVKFIMAGAGDLMKPTIELAAAMGIGHKVLFTGFLNARDVERIYQMADLYVMPSVSEPFGIAPLEALSHNVPILISKQSGVSEVLQHALKVDFWDIDALADRILAILRHAPLTATLREHAREEVKKMSWITSAKSVLSIYHQMEPAPV